MNRFIEMAAELLYPWCCPGCGKLTSYKTIWCGSCINDTWNPRLINSSVTDHLDGCYTLCAYHSGMRKCILQLKYNGKSELSKAFPPLLDRFPWWDRMEDFKIVIPVPLASRKMKERGYNHVDKMFQKWMESAGKEYFPQGLVRLRRGEPQSLLARVERDKTIKGAFHINKGMDVKGRKILLVEVSTMKMIQMNEMVKAYILWHFQEFTVLGGAYFYAPFPAVNRG